MYHLFSFIPKVFHLFALITNNLESQNIEAIVEQLWQVFCRINRIKCSFYDVYFFPSSQSVED